jgi:hypothetical protein
MSDDNCTQAEDCPARVHWLTCKLGGLQVGIEKQRTVRHGYHVVPGVVMTDSYGYAREVAEIRDWADLNTGVVWRHVVFSGPNRADTHVKVLDPLPDWHLILPGADWQKVVYPDWVDWARAMAAHALTDVECAEMCDVCGRYGERTRPPACATLEHLCAGCLADHEDRCVACLLEGRC